MIVQILKEPGVHNAGFEAYPLESKGVGSLPGPGQRPCRIHVKASSWETGSRIARKKEILETFESLRCLIKES
jgi:hypothetical protein